MPRKYIRKTRKPRKYKKRQGRNVSARVVHMPIIPDKLFTRLVYSESYDLTSVSGVPDSRIYQSSGFDPRTAIGGAQPLGWDQWNNFYSRYRIHGIRYDAYFVNNAGVQVDAHIVNKNTNVASTDPDLLWEKGYGRHTILGTDASGSSVRRLKGYMPCHKMLGWSKSQYATSDDTKAGTGANPTIMVYVHFATAPVDKSTNVTVTVRVRLTYYVEYMSRTSLTRS